MNMVQEALLLWRRPKGEKMASLQLRLFAFFALFILILALAFYFIMLVFGVFDEGAAKSRVWTENELNHLTGGVSADFGRLSLQGTSFAGQLSSDIDLWLQKNGIGAEKLKEHPERLEELLSLQTGTLLSVLKNSKCSGTFLILNATVNPKNANSANSRAGIFLKCTEPNAVNLVNSKVHYLIGPASIARENGIELLGQWRQEFDIADSDFYKTTLDTARQNSRLAVSRLYYWSERVLLKGNSESGLLLCVPLISRDGAVYGVCGIEFSSMLFKLQYSPDNSRYPGIFSTLSPVSKDVLNTDAGLIAGNSYLTNPSAGKITVSGDARSGFYSYRANGGGSYIGMHKTVKMYPAGSPYQNKEWALAVIMPVDNWNAEVNGNNLILCGAVLGLLILSLLLAVFISKRYIRPVVAALSRIKTDSRAQMQKTNIAEIDDLLEYLAAQDEQREALAAELEKTRRQNMPARSAQEASAPNLSAYEEFVRSIDTLSAAERAVFNLYMKGHTAKEISELLFLSMNTIKTHNKRIYTKLNVTSRKELMVYVQMMANEQGEENEGRFR